MESADRDVGAFVYFKGVSDVKLTDKERTQIITAYIKGGITQRELSERYHVSQKTISKILGDEKVHQKVSDIKKENFESMMQYFNNRRGKAQQLIDILLDIPEEELKKAPLRDKMGAVKILRDVFTEQTQSTEKEEGNKIEFIFKDASLKDE